MSLEKSNTNENHQANLNQREREQAKICLSSMGEAMEKGMEEPHLIVEEMGENAYLISSSMDIEARIDQENQIKPGTPKATNPLQTIWVDVIIGTRVQANGMAIEFSSPTIVEGEVKVELKKMMSHMR